MTEYTDLRVISGLQTSIMEFVDVWVKTEKTPVPRKEIVKMMKEIGSSQYAVKNALFGLLRQGYLRKAIMKPETPLNQTFYVQLRRI